VSSADILRTKEIFRCGRPHFFAQNKTSDFSKFMIVRTDKEGGGSIFRDFVRTSFMDGP